MLECLWVAPATLLKKETLARMFFHQFCKIFKNIFFTEPLQKNVSAKQQNIKECQPLLSGDFLRLDNLLKLTKNLLKAFTFCSRNQKTKKSTQ